MQSHRERSSYVRESAVLPGSRSRRPRAERDSDIYSGRQRAPWQASIDADNATCVGWETTIPYRSLPILRASRERVDRRRKHPDTPATLRYAGIVEPASYDRSATPVTISYN